MIPLRPICFLFLAAAASAQTFQGNLAGLVTDSSNAAVAGTRVDLASPLTGLQRTTSTEGNGSFLFAELPVGAYTVTVTRPGFATQKIDGVEVAVSKTTDIRVRLDVASQQTIVEVAAAQVLLETTSSDLAVVVNRQTVNDLPINGRDFRQLLKMAPGIQAANNPGNLSVNGTRTNFINYQIDGVDNNDGSGNNIALNQGGVGNNPDVYLPIEAIDQLSVQSNAAADMGRNGGANANIVIKSGTNVFHGSLYEYNRNEALAENGSVLRRP
jgi:Carboxypeptidase regulatory-like domain/TonB-dependent Receptor Plug Domain